MEDIAVVRCDTTFEAISGACVFHFVASSAKGGPHSQGGVDVTSGPPSGKHDLHLPSTWYWDVRGWLKSPGSS